MIHPKRKLQTLNFLKKFFKSTPIKGATSTSWAKGSGESRTNEQSHSRHRHEPLNRFTLLVELNVICEQRWIQLELQNSPSRVLRLMAKYTIILQTCEFVSQLKVLIFSE